MTYRHPLDPPAQHHAAATLGRMVARGDLSRDQAGKTMATIVRVARENAPNCDPIGLRMRLVHAARDAEQAESLAAVRISREQERQLADLAFGVMQAGGSETEAGRRMLALVKTMDPTPPVEVGEAAMKLARWRIRNGR